VSLTNDELELLDNILASNGNHPSRPEKVTEHDFYRRAKAMRLFHDGNTIATVVKEAGYSGSYAKNILNALIDQGIDALFIHSGKPRKINLKLSRDDIEYLTVLSNDTDDRDNATKQWSSIILEYHNGVGVYPLAEQYGVSKTRIYHMLNRVAMGQLHDVLSIRWEPVEINLTEHERNKLNEIMSGLEPWNIRYRRAALLLGLDSNYSRKLNDTLCNQYDISLTFVNNARQRMRVEKLSYVDIVLDGNAIQLTERQLDDVKYIMANTPCTAMPHKKASIILHSNNGESDVSIANQMGVTRQAINSSMKWLKTHIDEFITVTIRRINDGEWNGEKGTLC